jgi:TRAP-type C4-dicarboxylate transport system permease small subunit
MNTERTAKLPLTTARGLDGFVEILVGVLIGVMFCLLTVQIFFRYVLNNSIVWAEEVLLYMFSWMIFLGAAINVRRKSHVLIDAFVKALPGPAQRALEMGVHGMLLIIFAVMTVKGAQFSYMCRYTQSMALDIPLYYTYGAIPVSFALMTRSHLQLIWRRYFSRSAISGPEEPQAHV